MNFMPYMIKTDFDCSFLGVLLCKEAIWHVYQGTALLLYTGCCISFCVSWCSSEATPPVSGEGYCPTCDVCLISLSQN